MNPKALALLTKERVCVIAVVLGDGSPHAAEMHYSEQLDPIRLFIQTYPTVKVHALREKGGAGKAAVVLNLTESEMKSLQMRGNLRIITDGKELENVYK
ncbi:pyridoxamine 5'-phosphate oxidase family protein, partial [Candidatus Uhrbacteria bacterium]|nr:pyridoxamine 5'-phosphate oxidase family protein [Candidatus Uhrbacteria bacterium]